VSALNLSGCKMLKLQLCGCAKCGKACTEFCASCKLVRYCSKACQTADWKAHKKQCKSQGNSDTATATATAVSSESTSSDASSHQGYWGCPDCGGACTCTPEITAGRTVAPHVETCSHRQATLALQEKAKGKSKTRAICPGDSACVWLHCCESSDRSCVCPFSDGTADSSTIPLCRTFKYSGAPSVSFKQNPQA
jgi:hypothetical protein